MPKQQIQSQIDSITNQLIKKYRPLDLIVLTPAEYQRTKTTNSLILEIESKGKVIYG